MVASAQIAIYPLRQQRLTPAVEAAHRALRGAVRAQFDPVLDEPVPDRLIAKARALSRDSSDQRVVPFRRKSAARVWPTWGALAAGFALGALVLHLGTRLQSGPVVEREGQLVAAGALAGALSSQLTREQSATDPIQIGVSFRARSGSLCRTFQLRDASTLAGLACREGEQWNLEVLADSGTTQSQSAYRTAASPLPPAITQAVSDRIVGEPLDATAEAKARDSQWKSTP